MSLTADLSDLIDAKPVTPQDYRQAALFVLDALANALAGRHTMPGRILEDWARAEPMTTGRRALLLGGLTHILEMDDLHRASVVHPGCVVVPAALALADKLHLGGHAFLRAVLKGFEACCRLGMSVGPTHYTIWHNTATCGPFGSAFAAAELLGLGHAAKVDALGNAGTQSSGLWQFLETGAMSKHLHAGRAAEAGLLAADLAARGFSGPPDILEGAKGMYRAMCPDARPDRLLADADGPWQLGQTSIKPWPSCRHTHPAIDAALELGPAIGNRRVERIDVITYQAALNVCDRPDPNSEYEAKFSLQHCVAAALQGGSPDFSSFTTAARERFAGLRAAVQPQAGSPFAEAYPAAWGAAVNIVLGDGTRLEAQRRDAYGDPENPLNEEAMRRKAAMLFAHGRLATEAPHLTDSILDLAEDGPLPRLPL